MIGYPKQILIRNKEHLKFVASKKCMINESTCHSQVQAHHLLRTGEHGMGRKSGDDKTVPLCYWDHRSLHDSGDEIGFFESYGFTYEEVLEYAAKLYKEFLEKR